MKPFDGGRRVVLSALLVAGTFVALLVAGCSKSPVAPAGTSATAKPGYAPLLRLDRFDADGVALQDSLDVAVRFQQACQTRIEKQHPDVVGTAASVLDGRPVVLALTRKSVGVLPGLIDGHRVVEVVVGEPQAQAYYAGTSFGRASDCGKGTAGAIVTDGVRNYWLSNWHVFVRQTGVVGSPIVSPARYDVFCGTSTTVANVSKFVPVKFDGSINTVDCAIARIALGTQVSAIQAAGANSYLAKATPVAPLVGMPVKKVGATTGFTTGTIRAVNVTLDVKYDGIGWARFAGLVMFSPMCSPGDSGSLICTQTGNNPVALLFAGDPTATYGCPIGSVFTAMGARIAN